MLISTFCSIRCASTTTSLTVPLTEIISAAWPLSKRSSRIGSLLSSAFATRPVYPNALPAAFSLLFFYQKYKLRIVSTSFQLHVHKNLHLCLEHCKKIDSRAKKARAVFEIAASALSFRSIRRSSCAESSPSLFCVRRSSKVVRDVTNRKIPRARALI